MSELSNQLQARADKLEKLRSLGINPYPYRFDRSHHIEEVLEDKDALIEGETEIMISGRLVAFRRQGKTAFCNLKEGSDRIQLYVSQKIVGPEQYDIFKCLDL
ncbi:MAG: lysine--tRNA ligase, partial [Deltaproteobacteria bacterium]|nr:lysine--tRNA ligase [Deltaproteobacteria bacterium]